MSHYGIDVSRFQHPGDAPIDYGTAVRFLYHQGNGQPFAAVNAASPFFAADLVGFRNAGASVMAYDFDDPGVAAPTEEAHFRSVASNLPGALDVEQLGKLTFTQVAAQAAGWLNQPAERLSLLYSNLNYLANMPGAPFGHPVWFAGTALPPTGAVIWQYGVGTVPGIAAQVDLDRWVGTESQYATFFGSALPPLPVPPIPQPEDDMTPQESAQLAQVNQFVTGINAKVDGLTAAVTSIAHVLGDQLPTLIDQLATAVAAKLAAPH